MAQPAYVFFLPGPSGPIRHEIYTPLQFFWMIGFLAGRGLLATLLTVCDMHGVIDQLPCSVQLAKNKYCILSYVGYASYQKGTMFNDEVIEGRFRQGAAFIVLCFKRGGSAFHDFGGKAWAVNYLRPKFFLDDGEDHLNSVGSYPDLSVSCFPIIPFKKQPNLEGVMTDQFGLITALRTTGLLQGDVDFEAIRDYLPRKKTKKVKPAKLKTTASDATKYLKGKMNRIKNKRQLPALFEAVKAVQTDEQLADFKAHVDAATM